MLLHFDSNLSQFSSVRVTEICFHVIHFNILFRPFVLVLSCSLSHRFCLQLILYICPRCFMQVTSASYLNLVYLTFLTLLENKRNFSSFSILTVSLSSHIRHPVQGTSFAHGTVRYVLTSKEGRSVNLTFYFHLVIP
jgi:hypothetical protein